METQVGSSVASVKTGGHCFLCRSKVPPRLIASAVSADDPNGESSSVQPQPASVSEVYPEYSLQYLSHYLQLDLSDLLEDDDEEEETATGRSLEAKAKTGKSKSELKVTLSEECSGLVENFSELYQQLEENQLEDTKCLSSVQGKLAQAKETALANCLREEEVEVLKIARKEVKQKCSLKLRRATPRVRIKKLDTNRLQHLTEASPVAAFSVASASDLLDIELDNMGGRRKMKAIPAPAHKIDADNPISSELSDAGSPEWQPEDFIPELDGDEASDDGDATDKKEAASNERKNAKIEGKRKIIQSLQVDAKSSDCSGVSDNESESSEWKPEDNALHEVEEALSDGEGESSEWESEPEEIVPEGEEDDNVSDDAIIADKKKPADKKKRGRKSRFEQNPDTGKFKCSDCDREFTQNSACHLHYRTFHLNFKLQPDRKGQAEKGVRYMSFEQNLDTGKFKCKDCKEEFEMISAARTHYRDVHLKVDRFTCEFCGKQCTAQSGLTRHLKVMHSEFGSNGSILPERVRNISFEQNLDTGMFKCTDCDEKFVLITATRDHYRDVHLKLERFPCDVCGKQFTLKSSLDRHHKTVHFEPEPGTSMIEASVPTPNIDTVSADPTDQETKGESASSSLKKIKRNPSTGKFKCIACEKEFYDRGVTNRHYRTVHLHLRNFECEVCGKCYKEKGALDKHYQRLHLNLKPHPCDQCGKEFTMWVDLEKHRQVVHLKLKPYQCAECGKQFATKAELKTHHDAVHLKLKPHQCDQCGRQFSMKQALLNHHKSVHLGIKPNKLRAYVKRQKRVPAKRSQCDQCNKSFSNSWFLKEHVRSKHQNIKYTCEECGKQYSHKQTLHMHQKAVHQGIGRQVGESVQ